MRIVSNYSPEETEAILRAAEEQGVSANQLQAVALTLYVGVPRTASFSSTQIYQIIDDYISNMKPGEKMICSTPFSSPCPVIWARMTRNDKGIAAKYIRKYKNNGTLKICYKKQNLNYYERQ